MLYCICRGGRGSEWNVTLKERMAQRSAHRRPKARDSESGCPDDGPLSRLDELHAEWEARQAALVEQAKAAAARDREETAAAKMKAAGRPPRPGKNGSAPTPAAESGRGVAFAALFRMPSWLLHPGSAAAAPTEQPAPAPASAALTAVVQAPEPMPTPAAAAEAAVRDAGVGAAMQEQHAAPTPTVLVVAHGQGEAPVALLVDPAAERSGGGEALGSWAAQGFRWSSKKWSKQSSEW